MYCDCCGKRIYMGAETVCGCCKTTLCGRCAVEGIIASTVNGDPLCETCYYDKPEDDSIIERILGV